MTQKISHSLVLPDGQALHFPQDGLQTYLNITTSEVQSLFDHLCRADIQELEELLREVVVVIVGGSLIAERVANELRIELGIFVEKRSQYSRCRFTWYETASRCSLEY